MFLFLVRDLDELIYWVDGGFWGKSVWDSDFEDEDEDEDEVFERVLVV